MFCFSCSGQYFIKKDKSGEPIVSLNLYSLNKKMNIEDSKKIDTTALYVRLDAIHSDNPEILIFHNDGFYELQGKKFFRKFEKDRKKNSVYYGGKFLIEKGYIKMESFYPLRGDKTNWYTREISIGVIQDDTIRITIFNTEHVYVKKKYEEVFLRN